jgi:four helix bundle protein
MGLGFEDLEVYQEAREFRRRIFKLARQLPKEERYVLFSQMRRAALSATNNIAEGHGSRSYRHNISYLYRSRGSMNELIDDTGACEDEGYFKREHLDDLREHAARVIKLINGYIRYLNRRIEEG